LNKSAPQARCCVVGSGTRFLSGISYYTIRLANELAQRYPVSVVLMRNLLPARLYPGKSRVGAPLTQQTYKSEVEVFDGVDWYWLPSILRAITFLMRVKPDVIIFQWWTGTVLHSYLVLAWVARLIGAKIVIEFHEVLDTGEARLGWVRKYVNLFLPGLIRISSGFVIHSQFDHDILRKLYNLDDRPIAIIHHGPFDQFNLSQSSPEFRQAPQESCNILYFGVIRPFKGLEDLITAFDAIPSDEIDQYWLTIVGEIWEGWQLPVELIHRSRYRDHMTFIDRYVTDAEAAAIFASADAVALPYHRSSASGPLHIAMSCGLPVVVTRVGGLIEAVQHYQGALVVPPHDPAAIKLALRQAAALRGKRFSDPHSWERNTELYADLFRAVLMDRKGSSGLDESDRTIHSET
jgi:glycosyltransferase involved in cell wall biosynthesis